MITPEDYDPLQAEDTGAGEASADVRASISRDSHRRDPGDQPEWQPSAGPRGILLLMTVPGVLTPTTFYVY